MIWLWRKKEGHQRVVAKQQKPLYKARKVLAYVLLVPFHVVSERLTLFSILQQLHWCAWTHPHSFAYPRYRKGPSRSGSNSVAVLSASWGAVNPSLSFALPQKPLTLTSGNVPGSRRGKKSSSLEESSCGYLSFSQSAGSVGLCLLFCTA